MKQADKSKSTRPCPSCRSHCHGQRGPNDCPPKYHWASVCWPKPSESAWALIAYVCYDSQSDAYHTISPIQDINKIPALICSTKSNHPNRNPVLINIFHDSEASICLAGPHHLPQLNLKWKDLIRCHKKVKAVGGSKLICHGWLPRNFFIDKYITTQQVYFCDKVDSFYFTQKDAWIYTYYYLNFHTPWTLPTQLIPLQHCLQLPSPPRLSLQLTPLPYQHHQPIHNYHKDH